MDEPVVANAIVRVSDDLTISFVGSARASRAPGTVVRRSLARRLSQLIAKQAGGVESPRRLPWSATSKSDRSRSGQRQAVRGQAHCLAENGIWS